MTNERDDHIRRRAHEIWEREGRPHGRHDDHWAQAAREIGGEGGKGWKARAEGGAKAPAKPRAAKSADGAATATPRRRAAKPAAEGAAKPARAPRKPAKPTAADS